jgi:UDP-N-acetylglucosamine 4,6-dehydratase
MTRFWITLDQGAQFVARCTEMLNGGETFVAKLPSMRIVDLAEAIAPGCEQRVVGIRPGEKLHEVMVPSEEARHTIELSDFFVIKGEQVPHRKGADPNAYGGEVGKPVGEDFRYASDTNPEWMSVDQLREVID